MLFYLCVATDGTAVIIRDLTFKGVENIIKVLGLKATSYDLLDFYSLSYYRGVGVPEVNRTNLNRKAPLDDFRTREYRKMRTQVLDWIAFARRNDNCSIACEQLRRKNRDIRDLIGPKFMVPIPHDLYAVGADG